MRLRLPGDHWLDPLCVEARLHHESGERIVAYEFTMNVAASLSASDVTDAFWEARFDREKGVATFLVYPSRSQEGASRLRTEIISNRSVSVPNAKGTVSSREFVLEDGGINCKQMAPGMSLVVCSPNPIVRLTDSDAVATGNPSA